MAKLYRILVWVILIITASVQILAAMGILNNQATVLFNPIWLLVATIALVLSVIAFFMFKRFKWIPLIVALLAGLAHIVLAVLMMRAFPIVVHPLGNSTGITLWDALLRHMTPMLVPLLLLPLWWQHHQDNLAEKRAKEVAETPGYFDLLEDSYRMRSLDDDDARMPKPKRSVRHRGENTK